MYWANFLHIYQPPTQKQHWVKKIADESYRKLIQGFLANPQARATLNINGVLLELLDQCGCRDVIEGIKTLLERKQIELTASAKYHPFLPLMPEQEIKRQIILNDETSKKYFGDLYQPRGFFPPEMAYNDKVGGVIRDLGYQWIILDELAYAGKLGAIDWTRLYTLDGTENFYVFFRERETSFRVLSAEIAAPGMLIQLLKQRVQQDEYLITAMDGETFGHHRPGLDAMLFDLYQATELDSKRISDLIPLFTNTRPVKPQPSSWALMMRDIEQNTPFSRWQDKDNVIHRLQWELTNQAINIVHATASDDPNYATIRSRLDQAVHSDQYWWASAMPWWSIEMIERGAKDLLDVILQSPANDKEKRQAQERYYAILTNAFDWQRRGIVDERAKLSDEDVTQRITTDMPYIPEKEFNKIIANLEKQMLEAADTKEYERAAQIRDRVAELNDKKDQLTKQRHDT